MFFQDVENAELGPIGAAGLASVETLDDGADKNPINEDGMETVRLDGGEGVDGVESPKHPLVVCISTLRKHLVLSGKKRVEFITIYS